MQKLDGQRSTLDRQNKDLKVKLGELEQEVRGRVKSTIASLESKVRE